MVMVMALQSVLALSSSLHRPRHEGLDIIVELWLCLKPAPPPPCEELNSIIYSPLFVRE